MVTISYYSGNRHLQVNHVEANVIQRKHPHWMFSGSLWILLLAVSYGINGTHIRCDSFECQGQDCSTTSRFHFDQAAMTVVDEDLLDTAAIALTAYWLQVVKVSAFWAKRRALGNRCNQSIQRETALNLHAWAQGTMLQSIPIYPPSISTSNMPSAPCDMARRSRRKRCKGSSSPFKTSNLKWIANDRSVWRSPTRPLALH